MGYDGQRELIREAAARVIADGTAAYVIGWKDTRFTDKKSVLLARTEGEARTLAWDAHCAPMLAKYLLDGRLMDGRVAILARGCEWRGINRLIADGQIQRGRVHIIGVPCPGMDAERCRPCRHKAPPDYDELLWEPEAADAASGTDAAGGTTRFFRADAIDALGLDERRLFWENVYAQCIRCYACRQACPVCSCRECYVDMDRTGFQGKRHSVQDNRVFGVTRAFHVADRCIECGECERACPMGLPLLGQTQKIIKDIVGLAGSYESGMDADERNFLGTFDLGDHDTFM